MPSHGVTTADPFAIGNLTGGPINVTDISGGGRRDLLEVMGGNSKWISGAVKSLRPRDEITVSYELLDSASFTVAFGVAVNSAYIIVGANFSTDAENYPTVELTGIKPSAAGMIKAYTLSAVSITMAGGLGVVNTFGAASADEFISSSCSIEMSEANAMNQTTGDYMTAGLYRFGFKKSCSAEAYAAITVSAEDGSSDDDSRESRDGFKTFSRSWVEYMDPN